MTETNGGPLSLPHDEKAKLVIDLFHRIIMHHVLWFNETQHQLGSEKAMEILWKAWERSSTIQMKRLSNQFGTEIIDSVPAPLLHLEEEALLELLKNMSINWLANDGVWFQAVEFENGMNDAKRCNDSCWAQFSPLEAESIKRFLKLPESPGLDGLKQALQFRLYAFINEQSIIDEGPGSFLFQMTNCRVQAARKKKQLADYPCKSAGLVEYPYFAKAIDPRIKTECVGCPPDDHPDSWFCAWRFSI